jgi:autotransporter-associated beta strand protein
VSALPFMLKRFSILLLLVTAPELRAVDGTWTGTSGGNWSDATKWSANTVADGVGATADFNTLDPSSDTTVRLDADRNLTNLVFGDTNTSTAASWILDNNGAASNNLILAGTTPTITVNALGTGKTTTISAAIQGSAGLVKAGSGTLVLSGANAYTGATEVRAGRLRLGAAGALGDALSQTSGISVITGGILDLGGFSPTAIVPLTLNSNANGFDVGAFLNSGASPASYQGDITLLQQTRFGGTGAMLLTGAITGNGVRFIKDSTGLLELQNSGTVTLGAFQANRGTLQVNAGSNLSFSSIEVGTGNSVTAGLTLNGGTVTSSGQARFGQGIGSASATLNLNAGTLTVPALTKGSLTFNVSFNGGTLKAGSNNPAFFAAATNARVRSGGAIIDDGGFAITIAQALVEDSASTGGGFTKSGIGTLTLNAANTFTGPTLIGNGTLALGVAGSISTTQNISLAAGARFDVSAFANYVWPPAIPLVSSGGELAGNTTIDLGTAPVTLNFTPTSFTGDSANPALKIISGSLALNGALTVSNNSASPLGNGTYVLISQTAGAISGNPVFNGTVGGQGLQAGKSCELRINGGKLELVVASPAATTTVVSRNSGTAASSAYGDTLQFVVTVTPPAPNGTVQLFDGGLEGTLIGSGNLADGTCIITPDRTLLAPGIHSDIVARFLGTPLFFSSTSAALSPAQSVAVKPLTLTSATALDKYFDGTDSAMLSGTLSGIESGDSVSWIPSGLFASTGPGTNIAVTSTATLTGPSAGKYSLVQPSGLSANIIAASIWTGGAGGIGANLATGNHFSPAVTTTNPFNAMFNGTDPVTTDLTLSTAIGGAVGTSGMVFAFSGGQTNPVTITGSSGASARVSSILVSAGAGPVTFSAVPITMGGPASATNHSIVNDSTNPLVFASGGNWIPGGSDIRSLLFGGAGDITMASNIAPSVPARIVLRKSGTGTLTLSGANTFSGGCTLTAGKITATTINALGAGTVVNNGTLDLSAGAGTYTGLSSSLSGNGVVNVRLGTGTASTLLNGNYSAFTGTWNIGTSAAAGAGKVQMNGADNAAATIRVLENATLYATSGTHHATLYLHGGNTGESLGQLRLEGTANWAGNVILAGAITGSGDGTVGANGGSGLISGPISEINGPQALVKEGAGTTVLSGVNTYTGATIVEQGTLLVNAPGSLAAASAVSVGSGTRLAGNGTILGSVSVESGGTLGGSLTLNGAVTVASGGKLDATDASLPSVNATSSLTLAGFLDLGIDRTRTPKASNLTITGNLIRGGTLRILNTGPELQLGDSFTLSISAGNVSGSFASTLFPALGYGLAWDISQFAANGTITVVANTGFTASTTTLTPATTNQQIHGVGANFALGPQNIAWNNTNFNTAFSPSGLNISFARLSNSFECWIDEPEVFWSGFDSDNVRFIRMFRAIQPNGLLTISAWSPPGSLKSTGSANGGTLAKSGNAYRYADYANWWLRSLQYLRDNSTLPAEQAIPDFISIQNECDFTPSANPFSAAWQAGCYLNSTETTTRAGYPQALAAVKSAFQANGFGFVKFIGPDTTTASSSVISSYINNLPSNSFAAIAHHPYQGSLNNVGNNSASLSGLRAAYPNDVIYMTEFFGDDPYGPDVPAWMMHALPMHNVFTLGRANTYLMWGLSLSTTAGSFCALGHYSKFIYPGDWRSAASTTDPNVLVSLYRRSGAVGVPQQLVLVMINKSASYSYQTVQTSAHWAADPARRAWKVYKTADDGSTQQRITLTEDLSGASLTGNRNLVLAPYSITTILINSDAPLTRQEAWRQQYFGSAANLGNAADSFDSDGDGETNLYEFATGQDPFDGTLVSPSILRSGANLEFTYLRSKAAVLDGISFTVEWCDALVTGSWSSLSVTESTFHQTDTLETRLALIPHGTSGSRFVRLRISP